MSAEPRWFHATAHTYGAWLHGDPRSFRTRHHREHIEGDYKNPPRGPAAEDYARRFERSKRLLKQTPVRLTPEWRAIVGAAVQERLAGLGARVLAVAMTATHLHVLAQMPNSKEVTRDWVGAAKRHAWFEGRARGWAGQMWAKRSKATAIKDYGHQKNSFDYIRRHRQKEGAWVWTYKDPVPELPPLSSARAATAPTPDVRPAPPSPHASACGLESGSAEGTQDQGTKAAAPPPPVATSARTPKPKRMLSLPELLAELVRRPSVNPMGRTDLNPSILYESRVTDFLEKGFRALGCEFRRQRVAEGRDNIVATYTPPHPAREHLLFEAHQDTVPVDGMTIDPFAPRVEGGRLYGRGACDVKGGGAVMLHAFARLVRERPPGSAKVTLAFTVDEEHAGLGAQALMASGFTADAAIVAEPTRLDIVNAHKGVARWSLETTGTACHSSRPDDGVNAVYRMARLVRGVEEYARHLHALPPDPVLGPRTVAVGRIGGGVSPNTVPDFCRADVDRRLLPGETADAATADLDAFLRRQPGVDFPFALVRSPAGCPALDPAPSADLVKRFGAVVDAVAGGHAVRAVPFGTDASTIAAGGVPAVVFGPGDIAQAHTKDEWIELSQLEPAAEILFRFACGK